MKDLVKTKGSSAIFLMNIWKKDLEFKIGLVGSPRTESSLKEGLIDQIKQTITLGLKKDLACNIADKPEKGRATS